VKKNWLKATLLGALAFLVFIIALGFVLIARNPFVSLQTYRNQARCYAISIPGDSQIDESNPEHVTFTSKTWSGSIQFIKTTASPREFAEVYRKSATAENPEMRFETGIQEITIGENVGARVSATSQFKEDKVRLVSVFLQGRPGFIIHSYSILPEKPLLEAQGFADRWASGLVQIPGCAY